MGLGGIGSRGGVVLRLTKSGRAVYDASAHVFKAVAKEQSVEHAIEGLAVSAIPAAVAGSLYRNHELGKIWPRITKDFASGSQVDAKKTVKGTNKFKTVEVITSRKDVEASKTLSDEEKDGVQLLAYTAEHGQNAYFWKSQESGQEYVFASKTVNKSVLGHELGHAQDSRDGKLNESDYAGTGSTILGRVYNAESRAWDKSPFKSKTDEPLRADALSTYAAGRDSARITAALALAGGIFGRAAITAITKGNKFRGW